MKPIKKSEKGQILILLVLAIIGLLGITALALDGSMIYADRRFTQSVADSASLSGGNQVKEYFGSGNITDAEIDACTDEEIKDATVLALNEAISRAREHYPEIENKEIKIEDLDLSTLPVFTIKSGVIDLAGHEFSVTCKNAGDSLIVNVELTSQTNTAFAHLIYKGLARNTVHAETEVLTNRSLTGGYAIISLGQGCGNKVGGTTVNGTPNITIHDGGACSNSCTKITGNSTVDSDGPINYDILNGYTGPGQPSVDPAPTPIEDDCIDTNPFAPLFAQLEAACASMPRGVMVKDTAANGYKRTYFQGNYAGIKQTTDETMTFMPGLYCLTKGRGQDGPNAMTINGGTIYGEDVTFVILEGDVSVGGNAGVADLIILKAPQDLNNDKIIDGNVNAPTEMCIKTNPSSPGPNETPVKLDGTCPADYTPKMTANLAKAPFLFYVRDWGTTNNLPKISLLGTSASAYDGIVYAPTSDVVIGGTSTGVTAKYGTSIIGFTVTISGTSFVDVTALTKGVPSVSGWLDFLK